MCAQWFYLWKCLFKNETVKLVLVGGSGDFEYYVDIFVSKNSFFERKRILFLAYLEANLALWGNLTFWKNLPLSHEELEKLFSKVDLTGIVNWSV